MHCDKQNVERSQASHSRSKPLWITDDVVEDHIVAFRQSGTTSEDKWAEIASEACARPGAAVRQAFDKKSWEARRTASSGAVTNFFGLESAPRTGSGLRDLDDAEVLRDRALAAFESASTEDDPGRSYERETQSAMFQPPLTTH